MEPIVLLTIEDVVFKKLAINEPVPVFVTAHFNPTGICDHDADVSIGNSVKKIRWYRTEECMAFNEDNILFTVYRQSM